MKGDHVFLNSEKITIFSYEDLKKEFAKLGQRWTPKTGDALPPPNSKQLYISVHSIANQVFPSPEEAEEIAREEAKEAEAAENTRAKKGKTDFLEQKAKESKNPGVRAVSKFLIELINFLNPYRLAIRAIRLDLDMTPWSVTCFRLFESSLSEHITEDKKTGSPKIPLYLK